MTWEQWLMFILAELGKVLPDIIKLITGSSSPAQTAQDFIDHVKAFKK